jgi:hypothetical protein
MQFTPVVWGPFFWHTIHLVALSYPKQPSYTEKRSAKEFYESLQFLLPCAICREHYKDHLQKNPISTFLDRREDIFRWTVMVHNEVNKQLEKPTWTEQEVLDYYHRLGKRNRSPVWRKEDMKEVDVQSFVRGFLVGAAAIGAIGGGLWAYNWLNKQH